MMLPGGGAPAHEMGSSHLLTCPTSLIRMQLGKLESRQCPSEPLAEWKGNLALTDTGLRKIMSGLATNRPEPQDRAGTNLETCIGLFSSTDNLTAPE
jgi:hypothetical protein